MRLDHEPSAGGGHESGVARLVGEHWHDRQRLTSGRPAPTPIVGVSTVGQIEQPWTAVTTRLTRDEMATLNVETGQA